MALRVLLADESSTIKKVMQLALQDFAVEVKAVHVGVDVLEVARAFKPDVIFVDVLLQKKSGYEVCAELKSEAATRHVPTILMWSSFMELDQAQLEKAQPTAKIEKPFDVETLRKLVLGLVPETRSQRLSHFLEFPETLNDAVKNEGNEKQGKPPTSQNTATIPLPPPIANSKANIQIPPPTETIPVPPPTPKAPAVEEAKPAWTMESFDDINAFASKAEDGEQVQEFEVSAEMDEESFQPMNLSKVQPAPELALEPVEEPTPEPGGDAWAHRDLSRFKIELPPVSVEDDGMDLKIDMADEELTASGFLYRPDVPKRRMEEDPAPIATPELELDSPEAPDDFTQPILEVEGEEENTARLTLEREEVAEPLEPNLEPSAAQGSYRPSWAREAADVPQLSADRIEEIIRAQSREIIEEVVRRVVPDIATELIREELDRLLEETSVRESRRREHRP